MQAVVALLHCHVYLSLYIYISYNEKCTFFVAQYYLITEKMAEVDKEWPVVEDPEAHVYIRPEGDGLMLVRFCLENCVRLSTGIHP
jgi:hypothetical protein